MITFWHRRANISIGTVETLEPGADATASVTEDNVLSLGIPKGAKGDPGDRGPALKYEDLSPTQKSDLAGTIVNDLPTASVSTPGVVKIGQGLAMTDGVLSATGNVEPITTMRGATASAAGTGGTVPAPYAGDNAKYLCGDGSWSTPLNTTYGLASWNADGLMSAAQYSKLQQIAPYATKGGIYKICDFKNPQYQNLSDPFEAGDYIIYNDVLSERSTLDIYAFIITYFKYLPTSNYPEDIGFTFIPLIEGRTLKYGGGGSGSTAGSTFSLDVQGVTTNHVGARRGYIYQSSDVYSGRTVLNTGIHFFDAYYNGSKNNKYIRPLSIYAVQL